MKTTEFIKYLNDNSWEYKETEETIEIKGILTVYKHKVLILFERIGYCSTNNSFEVYKKAIEYAETPISEREDEKKYYIKFNNDNLDINDCYLFKKDNRALSIHDIIKHSFTQQEIDNLPQEIKGAIECGFLRKVEVK